MNTLTQTLRRRQGNYEMAIFSTFHCETQTPAFQVDFANDAEFEEYLNFIRDSSVIEADVPVNTDSRILTLVTCSYETNNSRTIVCGVLNPIG